MERDIDYNTDPVFYCKRCLSLKIIGSDIADFCDDCGSTDITQTDIFTWLKMYKDKYNTEY